MKHEEVLVLIKDKALPDNDQLPESGICTFLNPYSYLVMRKSIPILESMDYIGIDGEWLCKFLNIFRVGSFTRNSFDMTSLAGRVFSTAEERESSVYILASREEEVGSAVIKIKKKYPNLNIARYRNGYIQKERDIVIQEVISMSPDILIVGMGAGMQERLLVDIKDAGWCGVGYTCGGFMHQVARAGLDYYPPIINDMNLRWIYRVYDEPTLFIRYFLFYPWFVFVFIKDYIFTKLPHE